MGKTNKTTFLPVTVTNVDEPLVTHSGPAEKVETVTLLTSLPCLKNICF